MDDQGFDFRTILEPREPKRFVPPPWETDSYPKKVSPAQEVPPEEAEPQRSEAAPANPPRDKAPSEAEMIELLADLAGEEPKDERALMNVTLAAALALSALGMVLMVWGVAAFVRAGAAEQGAGVARAGAATMWIFGAGFLASAIWLLYRLMKQRGVL